MVHLTQYFKEQHCRKYNTVMNSMGKTRSRQTYSMCLQFTYFLRHSANERVNTNNGIWTSRCQKYTAWSSNTNNGSLDLSLRWKSKTVFTKPNIIITRTPSVEATLIPITTPSSPCVQCKHVHLYRSASAAGWLTTPTITRHRPARQYHWPASTPTVIDNLVKLIVV